MGRSTRLAIGAVIAAVAAGQIGPASVGFGTTGVAAVAALAGAVAAVVAVVLVVGETRARSSLRWSLPLAIGAAAIAVRIVLTPAGPPTLEHPPIGPGPWPMVVEAVGSPRDGLQSATLGTRPGAEVVFRVAATLPRFPEVVPGDRILVSGSIRARPDSAYGAYLLRIGAVGTLTSRTLEVEPAREDAGRRLEGLRRGAADALAHVLPEPEAGLAAGILIGLRDLVDRDLAAAFTTAGVSHVVAISGWNIAIVAAAIAALCGRLGRRRRSTVAVVAIVAYVVFAGASASVVRAAVMAGVVLLARETGRAGRAAAALGWAVTLLLLADPKLIGDAGFQLSSLATAGLIAWATPLTTWIERVGRGGLPHWLAESLGVSLAAQAATLPVILVSFGRLALLSPVVNLVVVPLVAPAMAAGLVALGGGVLVLAGAPEVVGSVAAAPGWVLLRTLVAIVQTGAALPFASVTLVSPWDVVAGVGTALSLVGAVRYRRRRRSRTTPAPPPAPAARAPSQRSPTAETKMQRSARRAAIAALILAVAVAGAVVAARPSGSPRITVLDVGQGDAILVEGSRGGRLLIDGGPDPDRLLVELDRRVPPWDRRIDAVVLSHPHEDHVAGLALLLARYRVGRVFEPGMRGPGPGYAAWLRELADPRAPVRLGLAAGDRLTVDEIGLRVLWPIRGQVPATPPDGGTGINNVSVVLIGSVGERRFLLMGDVEEGIDPTLLTDDLPHVDFLKVAHHGSRTATTQSFVDAVRPSVAVASAGADNPYGHPAAATLSRLAASGSRVLRTDRDGTVVVGFERSEMTVRSEGGRRSAVRADRTQALSPVTAGTPVRATTTSTVAKARFLCAIPTTALIPEVVRRPTVTPSRTSAVRTGERREVRYHRFDDGPRADGGRRPVALPRSPTLVRAARARRRRGRGVARHAHRRSRHGGRSPPRRVGRAPP